MANQTIRENRNNIEVEIIDENDGTFLYAIKLDDNSELVITENELMGLKKIVNKILK